MVQRRRHGDWMDLVQAVRRALFGNDFDSVWLPIVFVVMLCGVWAVRSHELVTTWESDLTLWRHAVQVAPLKPRPMVNYGLALLRAGQLVDAQRAFSRARVLARQPHIPAWDRDETLRVTERNLEAIMVLVAMRTK